MAGLSAGVRGRLRPSSGFPFRKRDIKRGLLRVSCQYIYYYELLAGDLRLRKPERLYIDFDGFFAACEEQADPRLQGRPIGVIPFADAVHSCVIAANSKAKRCGVKTGTSIAEARLLCPGVALVAQQPDLSVRVRQRIVAAILDVLPIDAICLSSSRNRSSGAYGMPWEIASPARSTAPRTGGLARSP